MSPATVVRRQRGNCYEMSTLLVSLLVAAGYDAYVVSGYAGQTTCNGDLSFDDCPLLRTVPPAPPPPTVPICTKYRPRPAKELRSRYETMMAAREQAEIQKKHDSKIAEELAERAASSYSH